MGGGGVPNEVVLVIYRSVTQQSDGRRDDATERAQETKNGGTSVHGDNCDAPGGQQVAPRQQRTAMPGGAESVRSDCLHHHNSPNGSNCAFLEGAWLSAPSPRRLVLQRR